MACTNATAIRPARCPTPNRLNTYGDHVIDGQVTAGFGDALLLPPALDEVEEVAEAQ